MALMEIFRDTKFLNYFLKYLYFTVHISLRILQETNQFIQNSLPISLSAQDYVTSSSNNLCDESLSQWRMEFWRDSFT